MSLSEQFKGKKILVTGAGRGIGRALCVRLHKYEAIIFALSQNEKNLAALEAECPGIKIIQVDIGDWHATRNKISELPPLDCLINNAGVLMQETFMETKPESFDSQFNINLKAVVNVSQVVAQKMIDNGIRGSIINMSSQASTASFPQTSANCVSKAALDKMTKLMAVELGPHKIRVNSINPGAVDTDMMTRFNFKDTQNPAALKYVERIPLGQIWMDVDDIVNTTLFVLSDMTTMMTGQIVIVNGGYHLT